MTYRSHSRRSNAPKSVVKGMQVIAVSELSETLAAVE